MAKTTVLEWAIGKWAQRASLTYSPICKAIGNVEIDKYGRKAGTHMYNDPAGRTVYKAEEDEDNGITYLMYDDDSVIDVPIIKVTEVEA